MLLRLVFTVLYLRGVYMQLYCKHYDFNDLDTANQLTPCDPTSYGYFEFKSYANSTLEPYRNGVEYYAGNVATTYTCMRTKDSFILEEYTEIYAMFHLNSPQNSLIQFGARYLDTYGEYSFGSVLGTMKWQEYRAQGINFPRNVTLILRAELAPGIVLGIEYFQITNSRKADQQCRRTVPDTRTTSTTDTSPTTQTTPTTSAEVTTSSTIQTTSKQTEETEDSITTVVSQAPLPNTQIPSKGVVFIYNIYNFISNFTITSKIIN